MSEAPERRRRAVFLDRDGVLNAALVRSGKPYPPSTMAEFRILDEARQGTARLAEAGFLLIVVTNQPDIARGSTDVARVEAFNDALRDALPLTDIRVCPHDDAVACDCRKPKPGLLTRAAADYGIDLAASFMVGDRWRDVEAGKSAGCRTVFIDRHYDEPRPGNSDKTASDLDEAATWILGCPT